MARSFDPDDPRRGTLREILKRAQTFEPFPPLLLLYSRFRLYYAHYAGVSANDAIQVPADLEPFASIGATLELLRAARTGTGLPQAFREAANANPPKPSHLHGRRGWATDDESRVAQALGIDTEGFLIPPTRENVDRWTSAVIGPERDAESAVRRFTALLVLQRNYLADHGGPFDSADVCFRIAEQFMAASDLVPAFADEYLRIAGASPPTDGDKKTAAMELVSLPNEFDLEAAFFTWRNAQDAEVFQRMTERQRANLRDVLLSWNDWLASDAAIRAANRRGCMSVLTLGLHAALSAVRTR